MVALVGVVAAAYYDNILITPSGERASSVCHNSATNYPGCNVCSSGQSYVNGSCYNNCTNGATNPPECKSWHMVAEYGGPSGGLKFTNTTFELRGNLNYLNWSFSADYADSIYFVLTMYYPNHTDSEILCYEGMSGYIPDPSCKVTGCGVGPSNIPYYCPINRSGRLWLNLFPGNFTLQTISTLVSWQVTVQDYY